MSAYEVLAYLVVGAFLGAVGQGARVLIGIKKEYDRNPSKPIKEWFDPQRFGLSLMIGAIAGILGTVALLGSELNREFLLSLIATGYAGTDFIEGFLSRRVPKN